VSTSLKILVNLLFDGGNIMDQDSNDSQICLTISQLVLFNCKKLFNAKKESSSKQWHSLSYEPPMPLYFGLNIHTKTRSKKLVTELHELGLCVSYNRVLQIENRLTLGVCEYFKRTNYSMSCLITQRTFYCCCSGQLG